MGYVVISMCWAIWFLNIFINNIMMLNFLIAIVSQSYEEVMTNQVSTIYLQRCDMNMRYSILKRAFPRIFKGTKDSMMYFLYQKASESNASGESL